MEHGIYAPIGDTAHLDIPVTIRQLVTSPSERPTRFEIGIIPISAPKLGILLSFEVATLHQDTAALSLIRPGSAQPISQQIPFGVPLDLGIAVAENRLDLALDVPQVNIPSSAILFERRALWISYSIPAGGTIDVSFGSLPNQMVSPH